MSAEEEAERARAYRRQVARRPAAVRARLRALTGSREARDALQAKYDPLRPLDPLVSPPPVPEDS